MVDADSVWDEIQAVNRLLESVTDPGERSKLTNRKTDLQALARGIAEDGVPTDTLLLELDSLEQRLVSLTHQRVDPVRQAGGGGDGTFGSATDAWKLNQHIDKAQGRSEIENRIATIRTLLADR